MSANTIQDRYQKWEAEKLARENLALNDSEVAKRLDILFDLINKKYPSLRVLVWRSFVTGLFTGLGATLGVSILLALLTYGALQLKTIPFFDKIIEQPLIQQSLKLDQKK